MWLVVIIARVEVSELVVEDRWNHDAVGYVPEPVTGVFNLLRDCCSRIIWRRRLEVAVESVEFERTTIAKPRQQELQVWPPVELVIAQELNRALRRRCE